MVKAPSMKAKVTSAVFLFLLLTSSIALAQKADQSAIISGRIIVNKDSIHPLLPRMLILHKEWPITFNEFEQAVIDTTDFSFLIRMDLDQLSYGSMVVNFHEEIDTTAKERTGNWHPNAFPKGFNSGSTDYKRAYMSRIFFSGVSFVIEPGDSIHVLIDYDKADQYRRPSVYFSGKGGANNNLLRSRNVMFRPSRNFKLPLDEALNNVDLEMGSLLTDLSLARDSISDSYFDLLRTDILFDNLSSKHTLIRASLYGPDVETEYKRGRARELYAFMDTLTLEHEYLPSKEFRSFLNYYLEYLNRIITGEDIAYSYDEENYYLARAIYRKNMLKTFLYERLLFSDGRNQLFSRQNLSVPGFYHSIPRLAGSTQINPAAQQALPGFQGSACS